MMSAHHLVVLHERYLRLMLAGRKRVECRLSTVRKAPFKCVAPGDLLWMKLPSRDVLAVAVTGRCRFVSLNRPSDLTRLLKAYESRILAEPDFFRDAVAWARYASLIWIDSIVSLRPMPVVKSDPRAWVVLNRPPFPYMQVSLGMAKTPLAIPAHKPSLIAKPQQVTTAPAAAWPKRSSRLKRSTPAP